MAASFLTDHDIAAVPVHDGVTAERFRDEIGDFGTLMLTAHDMEGAKEMWHRSFTRMAEEVWPKLKGYMESRRAPHAARGAAE